MEEEKTSKKKPDTFFNRCLSVAKNLRGTCQRPSKNVKIFILQGEHGKGGVWQRVLRQSLASCQSISSSKTKSIKQTVRASLLIKEKSDFSVSDPVFTDHVTYTVKGKDSIGSFECSRRYNDFFHLRNALVNRWPGTFVPKIPTKSSRKKDEKFIENRRYFLDRFMRKLEKQPHLLNSEEFKLFSRPTGEIDIMLSLLPKQDPDILIERYKTNLLLSDIIDENLLKQSKEEIEEFSIFAKNMIAVLKVCKEQVYKMLEGKTQQIEHYKNLMDTMNKFEESCCCSNPEPNSSKLIISDPYSYSLKRKCEDMADKFNNPYVDLYYWILGEVMDVEALLESIAMKDRIVSVKQKIELRK